ncbi:SGNH/GDSL hydrolase family protein [Peribacillus kribbensis]|uniref:SGNH/GDSL hydrolase family protein n=1 Tax=Peribacillus kribbensis TaxID=356658 RepID=UPI0004131C54|nr:GDSL-type esterase/lipase family protein [Peribacillus kribbensis]
MRVLTYIVSIAAIAALCFAGWFFYPQYQLHKLKAEAAEGEKMHKETQTSYIDYFRKSPKKELSHLALGDSVIKGYGSEENKDLVTDFSLSLEKEVNKPVVYQNKGINGITSSQLKDLIQSGIYNQDIISADIVTINVGGNDILKLARKQNFADALNSFDTLQKGFSINIQDISDYIKELNPNATVVFLELYNPLPPDSPYYSIGNKLLPRWNVAIYQTAEKLNSALVVETTQVMNSKHVQNLSDDGIHPSDQGYAAISDLMLHQFKHRSFPA